MISIVKSLYETLADSPIDLSNVDQSNIDREILRLAIVAELDAVSLYEQLSEQTDKEDIKTILLDVAKEEKTHVGEFQSLLNKYDSEYEKEVKSGQEEVSDKIEKD